MSIVVFMILQEGNFRTDDKTPDLFDEDLHKESEQKLFGKYKISFSQLKKAFDSKTDGKFAWHLTVLESKKHSKHDIMTQKKIHVKICRARGGGAS